MSLRLRDRPPEGSTSSAPSPGPSSCPATPRPAITDAAHLHALQRAVLARGEFIASTSFLVAEFRRPEFQVEASATWEDYVSGEAIEARFAASYYFGGAVKSAEVQ